MEQGSVAVDMGCLEGRLVDTVGKAAEGLATIADDVESVQRLELVAHTSVDRPHSPVVRRVDLHSWEGHKAAEVAEEPHIS